MRPYDELDAMEIANCAECRAAHEQINADQRIFALLRGSLEYAETCAAGGDTHGILAALSDMRRKLGMPAIDGESESWTVAELLAHAG